MSVNENKNRELILTQFYQLMSHTQKMIETQMDSLIDNNTAEFNAAVLKLAELSIKLVSES